MNISTRREFLSSLWSVAFARALPSDSAWTEKAGGRDHAGSVRFALGIASYTFRAFPLEKVLDMTARLGVQRLTLKDMHFPLNSSANDVRTLREKISAAGLVLVSAGVVYMKTEEEVRNAFAYARMAGLGFLVGAPDQPLLKIAERHVKETGIGLAIHNHGPTDQWYPSPESVYTCIAALDRRIGLCVDVGHTQRLGLDPSVEFERFSDRVMDVHIKDVSSSDMAGKTIEMGRGVVNIPKFVETLNRSHYSGTLHFEFEKDEKDPMPGLGESVGYFRGVLAGMGLQNREGDR